MKNRNGVTLIALVITIIILLILAGVAISYVVGDNGVVTNAMKMEVETAKGEVQSAVSLLLNEELSSASADIYGTSLDLETRYNEQRIVNYLKGNQNYSDDSGHVDKATTDKPCIEEFTDESTNKVINVTPKITNEDDNFKNIVVKSKYRVISKNVCPSGDKYGVGKNIKDGNIFTIEAIVEVVGEDGNTKIKSYDEATPDERTKFYSGKFQLKYYDKDYDSSKPDEHVSVLDTFQFYMTSKS